MPKKCDQCNQEFKGFGTSCSSCRKASNNTGWNHCTECSTHFKGHGICPDCKALDVGEPMGKKPDVKITRRVAGTCAGCGKDIGYGESISTNGLEYHPECYKCHQCGLKIEGRHKLNSDGKNLTCMPCSDKQARNNDAKPRANHGTQESAAKDNLVVCAGCRQPLTGDVSQCNGLKFHKECFTCQGCSTSLVNQSIFQCAKWQRCCKACAEEAAATKVNSQTTGMCMKCGKALGGEYIVAEGQKFHKECFACDRCGQVIDGPYTFEAATGRFSLKVRNQSRHKFICAHCK